MTPDEIRTFIEQEFKELTPVQLPSGVGWAFFLGAQQSGPNSNRILRVKRLQPGGKTKVKLSASARLTKYPTTSVSGISSIEFEFVDGVDSLKKIIDDELKVFRTYFLAR